jgi:hypothetical protein
MNSFLVHMASDRARYALNGWIKLSFKMAAAYSSALLKGDPEQGGIIKQTIKDDYPREFQKMQMSDYSPLSFCLNWPWAGSSR